MRPGSDIIGKPVISVDEGRLLGTVKDLYLDGPLSQISGLHLGSEGLIKRKPRYIPQEAIVVLGVDAVLVKSSGTVLEAENDDRWESWLRREKLQGREVKTPGGTRIGRVGDVLVDPATQIVGFALDKVYVEGPVKQNPVLTRGAVLDPSNEQMEMIANLADIEETDLG